MFLHTYVITMVYENKDIIILEINCYRLETFILTSKMYN